ncbi:MAG: hypothetical protein E6778_06665 [Niallia nealsonii]|nr:hypothetical protein [Niallia nealsonii]
MKNNIDFDFTIYEEARRSLKEYLGITDDSELNSYIFRNKDTYDTDEFLKKFNISDDQLLTSNIRLVSIHVTTMQEDSLKKFGLLNLQDALIKETPLKGFLEALDVNIDVQNKIMKYKNEFYDLNKKFDSVSKPLDALIRKLYMDFQLILF